MVLVLWIVELTQMLCTEQSEPQLKKGGRRACRGTPGCQDGRHNDELELEEPMMDPFSKHILGYESKQAIDLLAQPNNSSYAIINVFIPISGTTHTSQNLTANKIRVVRTPSQHSRRADEVYDLALDAHVGALAEGGGGSRLLAGPADCAS